MLMMLTVLLSLVLMIIPLAWLVDNQRTHVYLSEMLFLYISHCHFNLYSQCKNRSAISLEDLYVLLQENKKIALSALETAKRNTAERNRISQLEIPCEFFELATLVKKDGLPHETGLNRFLDAMFVGHDVRTMIKWPIHGYVFLPK